MSLAANHGKDAVVESFLAARADVHAHALHSAVRHGYDAVHERLLALGADVHSNDVPFWAALAARQGYDAVVQRLRAARDREKMGP